jgi:hypothetical protein
MVLAGNIGAEMGVVRAPGTGAKAIDNPGKEEGQPLRAGPKSKVEEG